MGSVPVAVGAAQAQDADALVDIDAVLGADAALGRGVVIGVVVVAVDVDHRAAGHGHEKLQVLPPQVAAGQDQAEARQLLRRAVVVKLPRLHIRYRQNLHGPTTPLLCVFPTAQPAPSRGSFTPTMSTVALASSLSWS